MVLSKSFILVGLIAFVNCEVSSEETLKASLDNFSSGIYKHTAEKNEGKNMVTSPLSAHIAMAMLSMGADGKTLEELQTALMLPDKNFTEMAFKKVLSKYNDDNGVEYVQQKDERGRPVYEPQPPTLRVVNKVFVKDSPGYDIDPEYKKVAVDSFRSEVENVDFTQSAEAASTINSWVEGKTNKKIQNLVKPNKLGNDTRMMLINAVYFKGAWEIPFNSDYTYKDSFHLKTNETVLTDFMRYVGYFDMVDLPEWDALAIKLPFYNSSYSMIFIVPNKEDGLESVEDEMASANLGLVVKNMSISSAPLSIPKFKIETDIDLKDILPKMGISKIFIDSAEFSSMLLSRENLYVSEAQQKAFFEINEYGCEAAAATSLGVVMEKISFSPIIVNVPFYYAIIDGNENRIFSGRLMNPTM